MSFNHAGVAELADALASGASGVKSVEVQILSSAPERGFSKRLGVLLVKWS